MISFLIQHTAGVYALCINLPACQVRPTIGDLGLCHCVHVTAFKCILTPFVCWFTSDLFIVDAKFKWSELIFKWKHHYVAPVQLSQPQKPGFSGMKNTAEKSLCRTYPALSVSASKAWIQRYEKYS